MPPPACCSALTFNTALSEIRARASLPAAVACLLAQRDAFTNWAAFSAKKQVKGWDETTPVCDWKFVECDPTAQTYAL